ncbi:hypothetical protein Skr01_39840 [Sphaerisporangium krabiense]|uniref:Uncharacterized protein n=1 Tax=Sphaerisporangium krabiense TaxID=763782 RepID=A0A7W8Z9F3_9ACTN|nr:hypothetical protein [Sphaerisporangium krabiense]MBB5629801.1 hypothetical protein [Sphaerisporangium krabiense]GII63899.1 hypothetical protein Skr01_39840 [Sphaerisporangium krabiense]
MVLITVRLPQEATLEQAVRRLGLSEDEVDTGYGLVPLDPDEGLYALRVTEAAGHRVAPDGGGPFSDPPIEPFGPPR